MTPKLTSAVDATAVRVVIVTLDAHLSGVIDRARVTLKRELPGLTLTLHAATDWHDADAFDACAADIGQADFVISTMIFLEDQIEALKPVLAARREACDAMIGCLAEGAIVKTTKLGKFRMDEPASGPMALLKRLRGNKKPGQPAGAQQLAMLKRLPQILKFIPGKAQDVRAYFLTLQYWLSGSEDNVANMIRMLIDRYADGPRARLRGKLKVQPPVDYPETGVYHPALHEKITDRQGRLPHKGSKGTVGLIIMRSYVLAGNARHYDGVIAALEARGLNVIPAFASGLDARPAIEAFFMKDGRAIVDAVISLTGFSLVGGPAYNDAKAAEEILDRLGVPYVAAHAIEFQSLQAWGSSQRGLMPVESTIMVAIPELDGAIHPTVFGGRADASGKPCLGCDRKCHFPNASESRDMEPCVDRIDHLAERVAKLVHLRRTPRAARKLAIVVFNFPPNAGNTGTAAYLSVFESLHRTLIALKAGGYRVDVPASVDVLRDRIIIGNAQQYGAIANVAARVPAEDHVRRERYLAEIEAQWGPAPGRLQTDGQTIHVLGAQFGDVFIGVQPGFGYEGDPMRLLFESGFAPTHAFSTFYRWLREDFKADAVLHFGTHGALEFMPGKQTGLSGSCWPDRLIGDVPNFYLYASNNPSEGMIAKRRSAATLISYLTPPLAQAGLYRGLLDLKASIERWRALEPTATHERERLEDLIRTQATELDLLTAGDGLDVSGLANAVLELEYTLIPNGLHVVGAPLSDLERVEMISAVAAAGHGRSVPRAALEAIVAGRPVETVMALADVKVDAKADHDDRAFFKELIRVDGYLDGKYELDGILHALDGRYVRPAPGGDILRTTDILPTGRNLHGFDPFRIPSAFAMKDGARLAATLLQRHMDDGNALPETVAIVLWGTDNLKSEGGPIAQALALMGALPRFDSYGRLCGAALVPLAELGRPRIDVMMTLSGIFRDLLPLQTKLLAEAAFMAASADEPEAMNFVRAHALEHMKKHGCDLETAALRVFSNADNTYGSNVNLMIDAGTWESEDELADAYQKRKGFAYGRSGRPQKQAALMESVLSKVDLAYQNLESVELGVTTLDQYFDTLGGISRAVGRVRGKAMPVYISDTTKGEGKVRTLSEQVALETRTRMLNPKWYEGMLAHGYEGVRQIEAHVTNTMGWSATTGQVAPWVYQQLSETFVLDREMRERLAALNPTASAKMTNRLIEAHERNYWTPDPDVLAALREASEDLEDRIEGIGPTKIPA